MMHAAAVAADLAEIKRLIAAGEPADPVPKPRQTRKEQFVEFAAEQMGIDAEQLKGLDPEHLEMIEAEMDARLAEGSWGVPEPEPESALCVAAGRGALPMLMVLLSGGADANHSWGKDARTPFHSAIDSAADPEIRGETVHTVLFSLVLGGGDPAKHPHVEGPGAKLAETPIQYARRIGRADLATVMEGAAKRTTRDERNSVAERAAKAEREAAKYAATQTFEAKSALLSPARVEQVGRRLNGGSLPTPVYNVGLDHTRPAGPRRPGSTFRGTFDDVRNDPKVNLSSETVINHGRGRAEPLEKSTGRCKVVMRRASAEGTHPADSGQSPTNTSGRAVAQERSFGSQLRGVLPTEAATEVLNPLGERVSALWPPFNPASTPQGPVGTNTVVEGD